MAKGLTILRCKSCGEQSKHNPLNICSCGDYESPERVEVIPVFATGEKHMEFNGKVYVRPIDRGILLDYEGENEAYLEDQIREMLDIGMGDWMGRLKIVIEAE